MSVKRNKYELYFEILGSLQSELAESDRPSPTRISRMVNMPYDRFQRALDELIRLGMVSRVEDRLGLTEKGKEFVVEYQKVSDFLKRMGFVS